MQNLQKRLSRLEATARPKRRQRVCSFTLQGPNGLSEADAVAFLRECGHEVRDEDFNIIRTLVGADSRRPVDLPLKDLTHEYP
ncbi:hypothetical protein U8607_10805 [Methylobacterium durans]|uniref:hypothetical protein n=1 Tax=Methylobacterium durans TaxID=2202825 RepID=UPI002AFFB1AC|nr:hypothetical protein [Methylobacterium durans]MEA1832570.1 hypothetical protein [Methylobacterium durans]